MLSKLFNGLLVVAVIAVAVSGFVISSKLGRQSKDANSPTATSTVSSQIDHNSFQAVFLNSGQVYFGKLTQPDSQNYKLTDVYYLSDQNSTTPVKLGSEPHQPQDAMYIPVSSVTFWENLQHANQFNGTLR